tara:strand:- start:408 stop:761 length:354 start_codon:yes stop_codon:yes gene_type:complete
MNDFLREEGEGKKKFSDITIVPVPFALGEIKENITITNFEPLEESQEEIINKACKLHSQGNIVKAEKYYQYCLNQGYSDCRVFSNYGIILKDLGKLEEAEISIRKAIELEPDFADAQ